jgi:ATP:ADP antiporter, AAA family
MFIRIAKEWFGDFSKQELKKFFLLGITFGCIIGIYWTMRTAKDAVFMSTVGREYLGWAKIASLAFLLPLVILYSRMLDHFSRHRILYFLSILYGCGTLLFGLFLLHPVIGLANTAVSYSRLIGWAWYIFVESYGSLMASAFWSFAIDTSDSDAAKKGFPFVVMIAQTLSIAGPLFLSKLAYCGSTAYVILACGPLILGVFGLVFLFMRVVPSDQLVGYKAAHESAPAQKERPGFIEGLRLLISQPYLLGIFSIVAIYETVITIIDFNFKNMVGESMLSETARMGYLSEYAVWVNVISSLCLIGGVGNIQRRLGLKISLMVMPVIIGTALWMFYMYQVVHVLFWIMVGAKALNYAINSPSMKQLYVPTSVDVKYKSQAWIETFGSRSSKAAGSLVNNFRIPFMYWFGTQAGIQLYLLMSVTISSVFLVVWLCIALYLGNSYNHAVQKKRVVC